MPEEKKDETPKRVERFIYSEEDITHIFRLSTTGTVFNKTENLKKSNTLLKKLIPTNKKLTK